MDANSSQSDSSDGEIDIFAPKVSARTEKGRLTSRNVKGKGKTFTEKFREEQHYPVKAPAISSASPYRGPKVNEGEMSNLSMLVEGLDHMQQCKEETPHVSQSGSRKIKFSSQHSNHPHRTINFEPGTSGDETDSEDLFSETCNSKKVKTEKEDHLMEVVDLDFGGAANQNQESAPEDVSSLSGDEDTKSNTTESLSGDEHAYYENVDAYTLNVDKDTSQSPCSTKEIAKEDIETASILKEDCAPKGSADSFHAMSDMDFQCEESGKESDKDTSQSPCSTKEIAKEDIETAFILKEDCAPKGPADSFHPMSDMDSQCEESGLRAVISTVTIIEIYDKQDRDSNFSALRTGNNLHIRCKKSPDQDKSVDEAMKSVRRRDILHHTPSENKPFGMDISVSKLKEEGRPHISLIKLEGFSNKRIPAFLVDYSSQSKDHEST